MTMWPFSLFKRKHSDIAEEIARNAESKVGVRETAGHNRGPDLQPFFDADWYEPNGKNGLDEGYAWCASFVCWCVMVAVAGRKIGFKRPRTPSAWGFEKWAEDQPIGVNLRKPTSSDIRRGDIVVFKHSHIGIAAGKPDKHGWVKCVEGNTNKSGSREGDGVYKKDRPVSSIRSRIRIL